MNVLKMVKLDFLTMKSQLPLYLVILLGGSTYFLMVTGGMPLMIFVITFYVHLLSAGIFQIEEKNSLRRLYSILAMKVQDVVLGRYLFLVCSYLLSILIMLVSSALLFSLASAAGPGLADCQFLISVSFLSFSIMVAVQTPFFMKLGAIKGRSYGLIPLIFLALVVGLPRFSQGRLDVLVFLLKHQKVLTYLGPILSLLILGISWQLSLRLYSVKT